MASLTNEKSDPKRNEMGMSIGTKKCTTDTLVLATALSTATFLPSVAYAHEEPVPAVRTTEQQAAIFSLDEDVSERAGGVVASIDGVEYPTLNEALAAAKDGQTVKVLANTTMTTGRVEGVSITLDLNGCAVEAGNRAFNVVKGGRLTLDDTAGGGMLKVNKVGSTLSLGIVTGSKGSVVMKGGTLEVPEYGIYTTKDDTDAYVSLQGGTIKADYGICALGNGTEHSAKVEISGGEIQAGIFGFSTNGSEGIGGVDFVMTGGTVRSTAEDAPALYLPAFIARPPLPAAPLPEVRVSKFVRASLPCQETPRFQASARWSPTPTVAAARRPEQASRLLSTPRSNPSTLRSQTTRKFPEPTPCMRAIRKRTIPRRSSRSRSL